MRRREAGSGRAGVRAGERPLSAGQPLGGVLPRVARRLGLAAQRGVAALLLLALVFRVGTPRVMCWSPVPSGTPLPSVPKGGSVREQAPQSKPRTFQACPRQPLHLEAPADLCEMLPQLLNKAQQQSSRLACKPPWDPDTMCFLPGVPCPLGSSVVAEGPLSPRLAAVWGAAGTRAHGARDDQAATQQCAQRCLGHGAASVQQVLGCVSVDLS